MRLKISEVTRVAPKAEATSSGQSSPVSATTTDEEKHIFSLKLDSFDAARKAKIIKEVKGLLALSLVEAKKLVESAPKLLKENVPKEDAEKIKKSLESLGAAVRLE